MASQGRRAAAVAADSGSTTTGMPFSGVAVDGCMLTAGDGEFHSTVEGAWYARGGPQLSTSLMISSIFPTSSIPIIPAMSLQLSVVSCSGVGGRRGIPWRPAVLARVWNVARCGRLDCGWRLFFFIFVNISRHQSIWFTALVTHKYIHTFPGSSHFFPFWKTTTSPNKPGPHVIITYFGRDRGHYNFHYKKGLQNVGYSLIVDLLLAVVDLFWAARRTTL